MAGRKGEKLWADAVRRAVMRRLEDEAGKPKKLERLADRLVDAALAGNVPALKEIGDRLDGRPRQSIEQIGEGSRPPDGCSIDVSKLSTATLEELVAAFDEAELRRDTLMPQPGNQSASSSGSI